MATNRCRQFLRTAGVGVAGVALVAVMAGVACTGSARLLAQEPGARQPHVIIHRQAPMATPENTWAALKQAVLWGADQTVTLVRLKK